MMRERRSLACCAWRSSSSLARPARAPPWGLDDLLTLVLLHGNGGRFARGAPRPVRDRHRSQRPGDDRGSPRRAHCHPCAGPARRGPPTRRATTGDARRRRPPAGTAGPGPCPGDAGAVTVRRTTGGPTRGPPVQGRPRRIRGRSHDLLQRREDPESLVMQEVDAHGADPVPAVWSGCRGRVAGRVGQHRRPGRARARAVRGKHRFVMPVASLAAACPWSPLSPRAGR